MKWLIIKSDAQIKSNTPTLAELVLLKHKNTSTVLCSEKLYNIKNFDEYRSIFDEMTHVVIIDESFGHHLGKTVSQYRHQIFLLGEIVGRNLPLYCINLPELAGVGDCVRNFSCIEEMSAFLNKDYAILEKEDIKIHAARKLFKAGIPLTVECFVNNICKDNINICKYFLMAGFDINSCNELGTPMLNIAVREEKIDIVEWMLNNGVNLNAVSKDRGYTAVMDSVWKSNEKLIGMLISHGASLAPLSKDGQSILVLAVGIGKASICKILVENGADPDIKDGMGMSAYEYAVLFKKEEIISFLSKFHKI